MRSHFDLRVSLVPEDHQKFQLTLTHGTQRDKRQFSITEAKSLKRLVQDGGYFVPSFPPPGTKEPEKMRGLLETWFIQLATCETFDRQVLFSWMGERDEPKVIKSSVAMKLFRKQQSTAEKEKEKKRFFDEFSDRLVSGASVPVGCSSSTSSPVLQRAHHDSPKINEIMSPRRASEGGSSLNFASRFSELNSSDQEESSSGEEPNIRIAKSLSTSAFKALCRQKEKSPNTTPPPPSASIESTPDGKKKVPPLLKTKTEVDLPAKMQQSKKRSSKEAAPFTNDQCTKMVTQCHTIFKEEYNVNSMISKILNVIFKQTKAKCLYLLRQNEKGALVVEGARERSSENIECLQNQPLTDYLEHIYREYIDQVRSTYDVVRSSGRSSSRNPSGSGIGSPSSCKSIFNHVVCLPIQSQGILHGVLYLGSNRASTFDQLEPITLSLVLCLLMVHIQKYYTDKMVTQKHESPLVLAHQIPDAVIQDSLLKYDAISEQWTSVFVVLTQSNLRIYSSPYDTNPLRCVSINEIRECDIFCEKLFAATVQKHPECSRKPKLTKRIRLQCSLFYVTLDLVTNSNGIIWFANPSLSVVFKWVKKVGSIRTLFENNNESFRIPTDIRLSTHEITLSRKLGQGGDGSVFLASWNGISVAVKKMHQYNDGEGGFFKEIAMLHRLRHPNIVNLFGGFYDSDTRPCIVTEYAALGSLESVLYSPASTNTTAPVNLSSTLKLSIIRQTAAALCYLHSLDIPVVHRDLKPANILLTVDWIVKLADFGLAENYTTISVVRQGTAKWVAPEIFDGAEYTTKADIYSFGLICWELFMQKPFFEKIKTDSEVERKVKSGHRPDIPSDFYPALSTLIQRCWNGNPLARPDITEVVKVLSELVVDELIIHSPKTPKSPKNYH